MAGKKELTLVAAAKPQLKKRAKRHWSKAKAAKFLNVLGDTCNVSEACRQSKVPMTVVYRRRELDAGFRAEWGRTIAYAYRRLELVLLERAFNGTERVIRRRDGSEERMREYSDRLGLMLLKMHRETAIEAETEYAPEEVDEIRERLFRKLQRLKKRDGEKEAESQRLRSEAPREGDPEGGERGASA
ncbi:MAG TPA: hypothetical protein VFW35_01510 [Sphingomicrobium sp.]|nr:hypothetical protein [Sphingomicrobium sp.]